VHEPPVFKQGTDLSNYMHGLLLSASQVGLCSSELVSYYFSNCQFCTSCCMIRSLHCYCLYSVYTVTVHFNIQWKKAGLQKI